MLKPLKNIKSTNRNTSIKRRRIFVGLSGGVDSAVSAALLKEQGYDVTGVFIKVWQPLDEARGKPFLPCSWREERRDAMRVALVLDIPFVFLDFSEEYKKGVADYMINEYRVGRTPNPDVLCNREVKFGAFWREAEKRGADFIATGHYAQVVSQNLSSEKSSDTPMGHGQTFLQKGSASLLTTNYKLQTGADGSKDQSYFLWTLTQEDLSHTLFPIGHLEKSKVRRLAKKFNLPVAEKKDSQGICFIGEVEIEEFLSHYIDTKTGDVLNLEGEVIGTHRGALLYTLGERHGFEVKKKKPEDGAYYVVGKNMENNTITVSNKTQEIEGMSPKKIIISNINWVRKPEGENLEAQIRYRGEKLPVNLSSQDFYLEKSSDIPTGHGQTFLHKNPAPFTVVEFEKPVRGLSLGQSIVFYSGEECLGGAVMEFVVE